MVRALAAFHDDIFLLMQIIFSIQHICWIGCGRNRVVGPLSVSQTALERAIRSKGASSSSSFGTLLSRLLFFFSL